ncbi:MAG: NAD(P)-dependent oxidoreductase [Desulfovibrio sp.]|nr:NAD(P)-dependent oxidoreductase [Desulfovibrio sp.]
MRILITGASGFIGSHLARHAENEGHEVIALCRSGKAQGASLALPWAFGAPLPDGLPEGISLAVHLAHDFNGPEGAERTIDATLGAIEALREKGVTRQVFYSSYSAGEHAVSLYGRTKYAIERALRDADDVSVIRPGLVLGDGGIYGRIRKFAQTFPLIPLPGGGRDTVPVIDIDRLCRETLACATEAACPREVNLFEAAPRSLRQLAEAAAKEAGRQPRIVPNPTALVMAGLKAAELLHLRLPVNSDNLKGLVANRNAAHISSLKNEE